MQWPEHINSVICGDAIETMKEIPAGAIQMCCTSPPYWGLRDYGLEPIVWGGDKNCKHSFAKVVPGISNRGTDDFGDSKQGTNAASRVKAESSAFCIHCKAWRGNLGLEPTPELYVQHLVEIFREVRRTLKDDGLLFLNMGDSYFSLQSSKKYYILRKDLTEEELLEVSMEIRKELPEVWRTCWGKEGEGVMSSLLSEAVQKEKHKEDERTPEAVLSSESTEILRENQEKVEDKKGRSHTTNGRKVCVLRGDGKNVSLSRSYKGRRSQRLSKEGREPGCVEKSNTRGATQKQIPASLLELQLSIRLIRFLHSLKLKISDIPDSIKIYFEEKITLKEKDLVMIPARVALALQADGWWLRSVIIWHKPSCMPESVIDRPTTSHEYVYLLAKSADYYYDADAIREPYDPTTFERNRYLKSVSTSPGRHRPDVHDERYLEKHIQPLNKYGRNKRTVWTINPEPTPYAHFATFPQKLVEPPIMAGSKPGDIVLDPFSGSATVGVVAKRLLRNYILIDLNAEYNEKIAKPRLAQSEMQLK